MKTILVTGGAGYVGCHTVKALLKAGYYPLIFDNLSAGHRQAARFGELVVGDLRNPDQIRRVFREREIEAVLHFAASCIVPDGERDPLSYYRNNVQGTLNLLSSMTEHDVRILVFSSTCAVYGEPGTDLLTENHDQNPVNVYGETKRVMEGLMSSLARNDELRYVALRYFNASGADPGGEIGEDHRPETHLIPLAIAAAQERMPKLSIFGDDYPTEDGTCIRDYIHVNDLASAHLLALTHLADGGASNAFNLGNGSGYSVQQVISTVEQVCGIKVPREICPRRPGDPPRLVGSSEKIRKTLGWKPQSPELETIVETAWRWHRRHPDGYSE